MTNQHPITPPPELVDKWHDQWLNAWVSARNIRANQWIANQSAQWGADQELEACCEVMRVNGDYVSDGVLRAIRRPKPPSLKEQALAALDDAVMRGDCMTISDALPTIRRALEALPND